MNYDEEMEGTSLAERTLCQWDPCSGNEVFKSMMLSVKNLKDIYMEIYKDKPEPDIERISILDLRRPDETVIDREYTAFKLGEEVFILTETSDTDSFLDMNMFLAMGVKTLQRLSRLTPRDGFRGYTITLLVLVRPACDLEDWVITDAETVLKEFPYLMNLMVIQQKDGWREESPMGRFFDLHNQRERVTDALE